MSSKSKKKIKTGSKKPLRFAHPFFNPPGDLKKTTKPGPIKRMTDYVQTKLLPIPAPVRDPTMILEEIIGPQGVQAIEKAGSIQFHTIGETGHENGLNQELVAEAMNIRTGRQQVITLF